MSPTLEKPKFADTHAPEPEPDITVHDDVDQSIFSEPSHEEIAALAYSYWLDDGQPDGLADEHWFRAERELRERRRAGSPEAKRDASAQSSSEKPSQPSGTAGPAQITPAAGAAASSAPPGADKPRK